MNRKINRKIKRKKIYSNENIFNNFKKEKPKNILEFIKHYLKKYYGYNIKKLFTDDLSYLKTLYFINKTIEKEKPKNKEKEELILNLFDGMLVLMINKLNNNRKKLKELLKDNKNHKKIKEYINEIIILNNNILEYIHLIGLLEIKGLLKIKNLNKEIVLNINEYKQKMNNYKLPYKKEILEKLVNKLNEKINSSLLQISNFLENSQIEKIEEEHIQHLEQFIKTVSKINNNLSNITKKLKNNEKLSNKEIIEITNTLNQIEKEIKEENVPKLKDLRPTYSAPSL